MVATTLVTAAPSSVPLSPEVEAMTAADTEASAAARTCATLSWIAFCSRSCIILHVPIQCSSFCLACPNWAPGDVGAGSFVRKLRTRTSSAAAFRLGRVVGDGDHQAGPTPGRWL